MKYQMYERFKRKLRLMGLSSRQYEEILQMLTEALGL